MQQRLIVVHAADVTRLVMSPSRAQMRVSTTTKYNIHISVEAVGIEEPSDRQANDVLYPCCEKTMEQFRNQ